MTGSVKPPGGGPSPLEALESAGELEGVEQATAGELEGARESEAASAGTAAWLQRVDAGEITVTQAVDGIVAEALQAPEVQALDEARRGELETLLRHALLEDPTFSALLTRG